MCDAAERCWANSGGALLVDVAKRATFRLVVRDDMWARESGNFAIQQVFPACVDCFVRHSSCFMSLNSLFNGGPYYDYCSLYERYERRSVAVTAPFRALEDDHPSAGDAASIGVLRFS
jgi:hypothetical protein